MTAFVVRPAEPSDAPGIRRLHARVFGQEMSEAEFAWKFAWNPDGGFATVAVSNGEIIGNYAGCGASFLIDGRATRIYFVGDVATDPSARALGGRRGVYRTMADAFYAALRGVVPFCLGFPNDRALTISHRLVGSRTLFPIRQALVDCSVFSKPPDGAGSGDSVDESFDPLWAEASRHLTHAAVRDRARVNWRFHARPNRYYRMVWWKERGRQRGWAVLSVAGEDALVADFSGATPPAATFRRSSARRRTRRDGWERSGSFSGRRPADRGARRSPGCPGRAPTPAIRWSRACSTRRSSPAWPRGFTSCLLYDLV